ncbi:MAG: hypothetical protein IJW71_01690 [Clostridia bacterium]|nr:hypothetical protein [Clostridia bacterium]
MIERITEEELAGVRITRLADRPNENSRYGDSVMSADALKAAFDALPLLICRKFNALIDALPLAEGSDTDNIADLIATNLAAGHSLSELFREIGSGVLAERISLGAESVAEFAARTDADLSDTLVGISYEPAAGVLTFTRRSGEKVNVDLPLERLVVGGSVTEDALVFTLADGSELRVPLERLATRLDAAIRAAEDAAESVANADRTVLHGSQRLVTSGAVAAALEDLELSVEGGIVLSDAERVPLDMHTGSGKLGHYDTAAYEITDTEVRIYGMLTTDYDGFMLPIATLSCKAGQTYRIAAYGWGYPYCSGGYERICAYLGNACLGTTVEVSDDGWDLPSENAQAIAFTVAEDCAVTLFLEYFAGSGTEALFEEGYTISVDAILSGYPLTLSHRCEYRIEGYDMLELSLPAVLPEDYISLLSFRSDSLGTALSYDASILMSGQDCTADGRFIPRENTLYDILFRYNGRAVRGFVSGVRV